MTVYPVRARSVSKSFNSTPALSDLSMTVTPGELVLLLGANGAGKSTLLRLWCGLARPNRGEIGIDTGAAVLTPVPVRELGYCGHASQLYGALTVEENLRLFAELSGCGERVLEAMEQWDVAAIRKREVSGLSKGMQLRVSLCRAFLHRPAYLFLDEPSSALDQRTVEILHNRIAALRESRRNDCVIVLATHDLTRMAEGATRVVILNEGTIAHDTAHESGEWTVRREASVSIYLRMNR